MNIKKCDRCGKIYELDIRTIYSLIQGEYQLDLCPDCKNELVAWIKNEKVINEVKRKAKVGEYIKLINTPFSFNTIGDILKVDRIINDCFVGVTSENHIRTSCSATAIGRDPYNGCWCYSPRCYVVLENYEPSKDKNQ